jgi:intracellular sulfur oxidation DsrE/DsrF family protein
VKPKVIFEPDEINELLRGWLLHAHKGRDRHDLAARSYDQSRNTLGILTAVASATVGTSAFAALQQAPNRSIQVAVGFVAMVAAVLAGLQSFLDLRARADLHRIAGVKYKAAIRELEQMGIGAIVNMKLDDPSVTQLRIQLKELEEQMPVVSSRIHKVVEESFEGRVFVNSVGGPP